MDWLFIERNIPLYIEAMRTNAGNRSPGRRAVSGDRILMFYGPLL